MTKPPNFIVGVNRKSNTEIEESNKNWKHNNLGGKTPNLEKNHGKEKTHYVKNFYNHKE